jgi:hypothetical protein
MIWERLARLTRLPRVSTTTAPLWATTASPWRRTSGTLAVRRHSLGALKTALLEIRGGPVNPMRAFSMSSNRTKLCLPGVGERGVLSAGSQARAVAEFHGDVTPASHFTRCNNRRVCWSERAGGARLLRSRLPAASLQKPLS